MKLSIVIPVMNQHPLFRAMYDQLRKVTDTLVYDVEFVVIDNGSDVPLTETDCPGSKIVRNEKSIGVYPTFDQGFRETVGDVVAFFHSDLIVWEDRWNIRVMGAFQTHPSLGLVGFIGSDEIDTAGGRGLGTTSNFKGEVLNDISNPADLVGTGWKGSAAYIHGRVSDGFSRAAVVDGCAMILWRKAFMNIGSRSDFPPHHFYDRLISTQMLEKGYEVGVLGIACDHISGQTVNQESKYQDMARQWLVDHGYVSPEFSGNMDEVVYRTAEKMWLDEYRAKGFIPYKVKQ